MRVKLQEWLIVVAWSGALVALFKWYGGASVWFLIMLSATFILGGLVLQLFGAHHIEIQRHINPGRLTMGTEVEVEVNIQFRSILPLPWMSVTDYFTEGSYSNLLFPGWRRSFTYTYYLQNIPRGMFTFQSCQVEWGGLFRYFKNSHILPCEDNIIVFPLPTVISLEEGWTSKDIGEGDLEGYQQRRPTSHWGQEVRDYTAGDPLSRVHWKSSARLGRLQIRLPEDEVDHELCIILDQSPGSYMATESGNKTGEDVVRDSFEWAISIAAGLLQTANEEGIQVELINGSRFPSTPTVSSVSNLTTLAVIDLDGTNRISQVLEEEASRLRHGTRLTIVTGRLDKELTRTVASIQDKGLKLDIYSVHSPTSLTTFKEAEAERISQDMLANSLITLGVRLFRLNVASSGLKYTVDAVSSKEVTNHDGTYTEHRQRYV
ncbi:DUF58 domain-containing protein [Paenibacillus sp. FA6]|uniref:DUF58 domain-containing protein n=1 Tax=Paenibacillus sp. FA6 TaxID=3413029 RepID=UPI003F65F517